MGVGEGVHHTSTKLNMLSKSILQKIADVVSQDSSEPAGSLTYSQQPTSGTYPEPYELVYTVPFYFFNSHFTTILPTVSHP